MKRNEAQEHSDMCLGKKITYLSNYLPAKKFKEGGKFKKRKEKEKGKQSEKGEGMKELKLINHSVSKVNKD